MNVRNYLAILLFLAVFGLASSASAQCPSALPGGTYTINAGAPASTSNFQTFTAAITAMNCGVAGPVVFNVVAGSGPYVEQLTLNAITGVSATNTITFNGNGNTLSFAATASAARATVKFNGADRVTINNLTIAANGVDYAWVIQMANNSDYNTINNCSINSSMTLTGSSDAAGIVMSGSNTLVTSALGSGADCDYNTFSNNTFTGGYHSIILVGSTALSTGNKIINNTAKDFYYYGIRVDNQTGMTIENNDVSRPTRTTVSIFYGIDMDATFNTRVSKNRIHNPTGGTTTNTSTQYGIYLSASDATAGNENIISNNLIYNFTRGGAQYGIYNSGSDNAWYFNNTIVLNDGAYTGSSATRGIYQTTAATGLRFENNIVQVDRGGTGDNTVIYMNTPATVAIADRNVYIIGSTGTGVNAIGYLNTISYTNLLQWQTATGQDANSTDVSPAFANVTTGNFAPTNPEINNMGAPVGVTTDITGTTRSTTAPDPGAYEFSPATCTTPPTAGATASSITTVCGGGFATLSLTGNSSGAGQTYQWQRSATVGGTYTNIGSARTWAKNTISPTSSYYYRAAVTCGANTVYSTPLRVAVSATLPGGTYTINSAAPTGSGNYNSFTDAVDAIRCGIGGAVTFNIADGTYNEQVEIPAVFGTSATNRVTFQSVNGAANVTLQTASTAVADNYVIRLDGASFFTFKGITVKNTGTTYARCIEIAGMSSNDSIVSCLITGPTVTTTSTNVARIFGSALMGSNNIIKNNTIENGSNGIYLTATTANNSMNWVAEGNTVTGAYDNGIYFTYANGVKINNNNISTNVAVTHYGIYLSFSDNATEIIGNKISLTGTAGTKYGLYLNANDATATGKGLVANNVIYISTGSTIGAQGIRAAAGMYQRYYNNTVHIASASTTTGYAGYFNQTSATTSANNEIRNNVFVNTSGGYAMFVYNPALANNNTWDYNNLYTTGTKLVDRGSPATDYADLTAWRIASGMDINSISHVPGFISATNLAPDPANPASWSLNGRGVQIAGNNKDINGNNRSVTLTGGVPDLGAYEFTPTVIPPVATAVPATPVQGATQYFIFGQDTVASIDWSATGVLPTTLAVRQYSGTLPPQLLTSSPSSYMYFYTHIDMPTTTYDFTPNIRYKKPWLGAIQNETKIKMIRKLGSAAWLPYNGTGSTNNVPKSIVTAPGVANPGYFTGIDDDILFFAFIYPGKRAFCPGGNVVLEANTGNNLTYRWIKDGNYITGATGASYTTTVGGVYEVEETKNGAVVNSDPVTVTMVSPPPAVIAATGNPVICVGGSVVLAANTGSDLTYQWKFSGGNIPLANGATYTANAVGTYTVEVTNPGCSTVSAPVDITTEAMPMATINPVADVYLCPGAATTLQAAIPATGINNITAQWRVDGNDIPGATGNVFHTTAIGNYTVTLLSPNCPVSVSPGTNVFPAQAPVPVISRKDLTLTAQASFTSYQWFKDGVAIPGANQFFHTVSENGVYTVEVSNGGCTGLSADYPVTTVGINDRDGIAQQINIYPNPAAAVVNIAAPVAVDITLTSVEGRIVLQAKNAKQINISNLPEGVYLIKVMDGNGGLLYTQKLLKTSE